MEKTRQAHGKLWLTSRVMITYLASHRLFLYIFGGNKSRTAKLPGVLAILAFDRLCGTPAESKLVFIRWFSDGFNAGYVFHWLIPFSKARSLWCCEYNRFLVNNFAPGPVQEVKQVEVIEQPCLFGFSWGANPLPNSLLLHLISTLLYM